VDVFKEYRFEAAHRLPEVPEGHPCGRLHGHGYRVVVTVSGPDDDTTGWVIDFAVIDNAFLPLREQLDHHMLNEIVGLENPTAERLAQWIWERLAPELSGLSEITVWETADAGCRVRAEDFQSPISS
jgi:6-pyruvoyltetrahydropterin/6-carboxytetrahydropterin synthase